MPATDDVVAELRELIVRAAPDPDVAAPVRTCAADAPLDAIIPFSSVIVLGAIIAIEDRYAVAITRGALERALAGGVTLDRLAGLVRELQP